MRSFTRTVVVGAIALPLALAGAGLASADPGGAHHRHHHLTWLWGFEKESNVINAGVINSNSNNGVAGQKH